MDEISRFFEQLKDYLGLQKQSISVTTAEGVSKVLSSFLLVIIVIMLGSIMLLLLALGAAYYIGNLIGSESAGFLILFAVVAVIFAIIWFNRKRWIDAPIDALTSEAMGVTGVDRAKVKEDAAKSQQALSETFSAAMAPLPKAKNRMETFSQLISRGTMIFEGVVFGMKVVRGFRSAFRK